MDFGIDTEAEGLFEICECIGYILTDVFPNFLWFNAALPKMRGYQGTGDGFSIRTLINEHFSGLERR